MNAPRSSRCIFCSFSRPLTRRTTPQRQFHSSPSQCKPKYPNVKASEMGLRKRPAKPTRADIEPYSAEEQQQFNKKYTEAQLASIHAGDSAIDPEDLKSQATVRRDAWSLKYIDDLSHIEPVIDQPIRAPYSNTDPFAREKTDDEEDDEIMAWLEKTPESELEVDNFKTFSAGVRHTVGKPESEFSPRSSLAPTLFDNNDNFQSHKQKRKPASSSSGGKDNNKPDEEIAPGLLRLMQQTGLDARAIQSLRVKTLVINAVTNQTRLGKIQKDYVLAIAGNGAGMLGLGEGKSEESGEAVQQAHYKAIRNMQPILRYEDRTIYGDVKGKVGATELELFTRPPGFGVRASAYIWEMCRAAGISDIGARVTRARNPMNIVKAAHEALMSQRHPEDIARARGKKMVDVRKVYYAGMV